MKSVLLSGSETWRRTRISLQKIQTFIFNIWRPEKIRREELWQRGEQQPVGKQILRRKWGWIGHTLQKASNNITRQALRWNARRKGSRGRDTDAELKLIGYNWKEAEPKAQVRVC